MTYNVNYFIKKFEAVPEEQWGTGDYVNSDGTMCALGLCGYRLSTVQFIRTEEGLALVALLGKFLVDINDNDYPKYSQDTPKQRILAALNDVKNEVF